jgi:hypothetical protein
MSAFNRDTDDLNEYFYTSFVEMWEFLSSPSEREDGIDTINDYRAALGKTDKFIDWVREQIELSITNDKYFIGAVLNTLDIDGLMARLNDWMDSRTCHKCHLVLSECECEKEYDGKFCWDCDQLIKINSGAECGSCHIKYCDKCIIDVSKDDDWTLTHVCKGCKEEMEKVDYATTIITGIVCKSCKNELPAMTMQDHLDCKFNQECPHSETPPTTQAGLVATKAC